MEESACPVCGAKVAVGALVGPVTAGFVGSPDKPVVVISEVELATCRKTRRTFLRRVKSAPASLWELAGL